MHTPRQSSGLRFLENLAYLVPGYHGYKRRELRQEEDSRLRARVHAKLVQMTQALEEIRERWSGESRGTHMDQLHQRRLRLQSIADSVRYSPYGFKGFFDTDPLNRQILDQLLEADLLILDDLAAAEVHLAQNGCSVTTAPRTSRCFFRDLDEVLCQLEGHLIMREKILASA